MRKLQNMEILCPLSLYWSSFNVATMVTVLVVTVTGTASNTISNVMTLIVVINGIFQIHFIANERVVGKSGNAHLIRCLIHWKSYTPWRLLLTETSRLNLSPPLTVSLSRNNKRSTTGTRFIQANLKWVLNHSLNNSSGGNPLLSIACDAKEFGEFCFHRVEYVLFLLLLFTKPFPMDIKSLNDRHT